MKSGLVTLISLFLSVTIMSAGEEKIVASSESWSGATEADGTGLYWDILRAVYEPEGYSIETDLRSYEGSVNRTQQKDCDLMVGSYEDEIEGVIYPTHPFAVDVVQAVAKRVTGMDSPELKGNRWGWIKDYGYEDYLEPEILNRIEIRELANRDALWRMLSMDKLDVIVDARADVQEYIDAHADAYPADTYFTKDIMELKLYFAFADTERGQKLASVFDQRIQALVKSGELKALYAKYEDQDFQFPSALKALEQQ